MTRPHLCHWPGCGRAVSPHLWGCREHWFRLPKALRKKIWAAYRPGQEIDKKPSDEYIAIARGAQDWIAARPAQGRLGLGNGD